MQNGVGKIYEVDLDGTLCSNTNGAYEHAAPFKDRIEKINQLYNNGNIINKKQRKRKVHLKLI